MAPEEKTSVSNQYQKVIDSAANRIFVAYNKEIISAPSENVQGMKGMARPQLLWQVRQDFVARAKMLNEEAVSLGLKPPFDPKRIADAEVLAVPPGLLA